MSKDYLLQNASFTSTENPNNVDQDEEEKTCIEEMTKSNDKSQTRVWLSYFCLVACISCWIIPLIFPKVRKSIWYGPLLGVGLLFGIAFSATNRNFKVVKIFLRLLGAKIDF